MAGKAGSGGGWGSLELGERLAGFCVHPISYPMDQHPQLMMVVAIGEGSATLRAASITGKGRRARFWPDTTPGGRVGRVGGGRPADLHLASARAVSGKCSLGG
jgi:hypothetical protein